ncbi:MAG: hypothetical protein RL272_107, partial [Candidatus Parcubacteria bacterium]
MSAPNAAKNGLFIGVAIFGALVVMAWIVSVRLGGAPMPRGGAGTNPAFGTPADLSRLAGGAVNDDAPGGAGPLPVLAAAMPEFSGIGAWLNSKPLTPADLKGKVVLVDFWTYSCVNCLRT